MATVETVTVAHLDFVRVGDWSPWGRVDCVTHVAPGIQFVSTDRHGGYVVSRERLASMPEHLRRCSFNAAEGAPRYFEEDCSWCAVALAWPEEFTRGFDAEKRARCLEDARGTFERYYAGREGGTR